MTLHDRLDSLIDQLRSEHDAQLRPLWADQVRRELNELVACAPTETVRAHLLGLLDERTLDPYLDSYDFPSRAAVLDALHSKELWARELPALELEFLRRARARSDGGAGSSRVVT